MNKLQSVMKRQRRVRKRQQARHERRPYVDAKPGDYVRVRERKFAPYNYPFKYGQVCCVEATSMVTVRYFYPTGGLATSTVLATALVKLNDLEALAVFDKLPGPLPKDIDDE